MLRTLRAGTCPLKHVMAAPKRGNHFAAMPYADVPAFVQSLRKVDTVYARALEYCVLTWARKREVLDLPWSEIDLDKALWTVPAARMKSRDEAHEVPLTKRALEILRVQHVATGGKGLVFPSAATGKSISDPTLAKLVPRPYTIHGFRSRRDFTGDQTDIPREIAEGCLAHTTGSAVERAYRRGNALEKRGMCLKTWADYLDR